MNIFTKFLKEEDGMGVVEIILIIVEYYLSPIPMYIVYKDILAEVLMR